MNLIAQNVGMEFFIKNFQITRLFQNGKSKTYWILSTMKNKMAGIFPYYFYSPKISDGNGPYTFLNSSICCEKTGNSKADIIRIGLKKVYDELK